MLSATNFTIYHKLLSEGRRTLKPVTALPYPRELVGDITNSLAGAEYSSQY